MKRIRLRAVHLSMLVVASLVACGREEPVSDPELRPVRYQKVSVGNVDTSRTLVGVARAGTEADLSFRVEGTVEQVLVSRTRRDHVQTR